jgi:hypothetical protein
MLRLLLVACQRLVDKSLLSPSGDNTLFVGVLTLLILAARGVGANGVWLSG